MRAHRRYPLAGSALFITGMLGRAAACPQPACPPEAKYCFFPNTPKSHCEASIIAGFKGLTSPVQIEIEKQIFTVTPAPSPEP